MGSSWRLVTILIMKLNQVNLLLITLIYELLDEIEPFVFLTGKRVDGLMTLEARRIIFIRLILQSFLNNFFSLFLDVMMICLCFFLDAGELPFVVDVLQL